MQVIAAELILAEAPVLLIAIVIFRLTVLVLLFSIFCDRFVVIVII